MVAFQGVFVFPVQHRAPFGHLRLDLNAQGVAPHLLDEDHGFFQLRLALAIGQWNWRNASAIRVTSGGEKLLGFRGVIRQALELRVKAGDAFRKNVLRGVAPARKHDLDDFLFVGGIRQRLPDANVGKRRKSLLIEAQIVSGSAFEQLHLVFQGRVFGVIV